MRLLEPSGFPYTDLPHLELTGNVLLERREPVPPVEVRLRVHKRIVHFDGPEASACFKGSGEAGGPPLLVVSNPPNVEASNPSFTSAFCTAITPDHQHSPPIPHASVTAGSRPRIPHHQLSIKSSRSSRKPLSRQPCYSSPSSRRSRRQTGRFPRQHPPLASTSPLPSSSPAAPLPLVAQDGVPLTPALEEGWIVESEESTRRCSSAATIVLGLDLLRPAQLPPPKK